MALIEAQVTWAEPIEDNSELGFTLLELLVTLLVAFLAVSSVYAVYSVQRHEYRNQQAQLTAQQNLRGSLVVLKQEINMAGFDPEDSGDFGVVDIRRYNPISTAVDPGGFPALFYTSDWNENGKFDSNEIYGLRIRHDPKLGRTFLTLTIGASGRQLLAENIEAWSIAYAIDVDQDGFLDTWAGGPHFVWAVDTNNDNLLDAHLDTNNDGKIDSSDDVDDDQVIGSNDGGKLDPPIPVQRIKAVRVWLLSATDRRVDYDQNHQVLVVGDRIYSAPRDGIQRKVMEMVIMCRNL